MLTSVFQKVTSAVVERRLFPIFYFQALRSRYEGRTREEAFHLVKARHWSLGHNIVLRGLVSDAIINGENLNNSFMLPGRCVLEFIVIQRFKKLIPVVFF